MVGRALLLGSAVLGCSLLLAAACRSSSGSKQPGAVSPGASSSVVAVPPTATPTLSPEQAAAATAGPNADLVDYRDPDGRYTVKQPRGWVRQESPNWVLSSQPSDQYLTTFGIFCDPGGTAANLIAQDASVANNVGRRRVVNEGPASVAGGPAQLVVSVTSLSTLPLNNVTYYFEGHGCAWRVQLTTTSGVDYAGLAARLVASFKFIS